LCTGKRLARRNSEVHIKFKKAPMEIFRNTDARFLDCNQLVLTLQPQEKISLRFGAKVPGAGMRVGCVEMQMDYQESFGRMPNTGYETLLFDCMNGDGTLFQRADQVEASWEVVQPILDMWAAQKADGFPNYPAGSWGPIGWDS
jgi:glucose-6-phosphate 1-dehydrogenase